MTNPGADEGTTHFRRVNFVLADAKLELERLIAEGTTLAVEEVIEHHPIIGSSPEAMLELVYLEYVLLQERGIETSTESILARFPHLSNELARMLEVDQAINRRGEAVPFSTPASRPLDTIGVPNSNPRIERLRVAGARIAHDDIPGYDVLEILGRGGMGLVYKARQSRLNRLVALKTIDVLSSFNPRIVRRFRTEAELAASLQHPNIVQIHEIGTHDEVPYFSMELVNGGSLQSVLTEQTLRPVLAARLVEILAIAVQYAHEHGVIHRDLKPSNILLAPSSRAESLTGLDSKRPTVGFEPKIADFGLAKHLASELHQTQSGDMIGTPGYMAPEQIAGSDATVGPACDVYSLGVILYQSLIGRPPFEGATPIETLEMVRSADPIRPSRMKSGIPYDLETICLTCLQKEPKRRYASAELLASDLRDYLDSKPIRARPTSPLMAAAKWISRNRSLTLTLTTLLIAATCSSVLWWRAETHRRSAEMFGEKAVTSASNERQQRERAEAVVYTQKIATARLEYLANNFNNCRSLLESCDPKFRKFEWGYLHSLTHSATWDSPPMPIPVSSVAMSPNGDLVAAAYGNSSTNFKPLLRVWDTRSDQDPIDLEHHLSCIHDLSFSHDGSWLVSAGGWMTQADERAGKKDGVVVWDIQHRSKRLVIGGINATVARFTPDKPTLIVGQPNGRLDEYSLATGELLREYKSHTRAVKDLTFGPKQRMATISEDGSLYLWDRALKQSSPFNFVSSLGKLSSVAWSPDGKKLHIAGLDGQMKKFNIQEQRIFLTDMYNENGSTRIALSPDGQFLATAVQGAATSLQVATTGKRMLRFPGHNANVTDLTFDGLGSRLCMGGIDGSVSVWERVQRNDNSSRFAMTTIGIRTIASHPKRNLAAIGLNFAPKKEERLIGAFVLFAFMGMEQDHLLQKSNWGPDTRLFVVDSLNARNHRGLAGDTDRANVLAFSRSGQLVAAGCQDGRIIVWEVDDLSLDGPHEALQPIQSMTIEGTKPLSSVCFAGGDETVIAVTSLGTVHRWNRDDNSVVHLGSAFPEKLSDEVTLRSAISPDGRIIAFSDGSCVFLWSTFDRKEITRLPDMDGVNDLAFSSDGRTLATGQESGIIQLFRATDSELPNTFPNFAKWHTLRSHSDSVTSVSISADCSRLVSCSRDGSTRIFDIDVGSELLSLQEDSASQTPQSAHLMANGKTVITAYPTGFNMHRDSSVVVERRSALIQRKSIAPDMRRSFESFEAEIDRWHLSESTRAQLQHDWCAIGFHLEHLLRVHPNDTELQLTRAICHSFQLDLASAEVCLQQLIEMDSENVLARSRLALIMLKSGRIPEYRDQCEMLLEQASRSASSRAVDRALMAIMASSESQVPQVEQFRLLKIADDLKIREQQLFRRKIRSWIPEIKPLGSGNGVRTDLFSHFPSIPALIAYRHGDFGNSISLARKNSSPSSVDYIMCQLVVGMSYAKLGKRDQAFKWLSSAEKRIYDRREKRWTQQNDLYLDIANMEQAILLEEARALIQSATRRPTP